MNKAKEVLESVFLYSCDPPAEISQSGFGYSSSAAYGSAMVEMGNDETWEELSPYSNSPTQSGQRPSLGLIKTTEFNRLPGTPDLLGLVDGTDIKLDPEIIAERETAIANFREEIRKRLAIRLHSHPISIAGPACRDRVHRGFRRAALLWR